MAHRNFLSRLESPWRRRSGRTSPPCLFPGRLGIGTCVGRFVMGLVLVSPALATASPEPAKSRLGNLETRLAWQSDPASEPPQTPVPSTAESQPATSQGTAPEAMRESAASPDTSSTDLQASPQPAADSPATATESPSAAATSPTNASRPPVPIPPDANSMAWRREILTVSLLGVMGVGCTIAAFFAVWILSKNLRPSDS